MRLVPMNLDGSPTNEITPYCLIQPIHDLALEVFTVMLNPTATSIAYIEAHFDTHFRMYTNASNFGFCIDQK